MSETVSQLNPGITTQLGSLDRIETNLKREDQDEFKAIHFQLCLEKQNITSRRSPACIMSLCHLDQTNCFEAPLHMSEALYHMLRDYYLPNIHIMSKYLTAVLYNVLMAYFVKVCYNI